MPNHETNHVVILGDPEKVRAFTAEGLRELAEEDRKPGSPERILDFELIVPQPATIERGSCNGTHDPGVVCWYSWNPIHWGTKWNAYSHSHYSLRFLSEREGAEPYGRVDLRFETAWSQPTPIFEAIESRWGVKVHAVTQDEGGCPDVVFGDPMGLEVLTRVVTFEFETWDAEVSA